MVMIASLLPIPAGVASAAAGGPAVVWATDPTQPGQTLAIEGDSFIPGNTVVMVGRGEDGKIDAPTFASGVITLAEQGTTVITDPTWTATSTDATTEYQYIRVSTTVRESGDVPDTAFWKNREFMAYGLN